MNEIGGKHLWRITSLLLSALSLSLLSHAQTTPPRKALEAPLIEEVRKGNLAAAERLLQQGANANAQAVVLSKPSLADHDVGNVPTLGDTALMIAAQNGSVAIMKLLLQHGADVNGRGTAGYTPLFEAVIHRRAEAVELLLTHGARPNLRNDTGDTALVFAANDGQIALVTSLLRHGADIDGGAGWTPLMDAAYNGQTDVVKLLIRKGAHVNLRRKGMMNALECALAQGNDDIAAIIRRAGGRGHYSKALRGEEEQAARKERHARETELHARALRWRQERVWTDEDRQVVETVLLDLLTYKGEDLDAGNRSNSEIILIDKTVKGWYADRDMDNDLNSSLSVSQANDISLEMRESVMRRNGEPVSLKGLQIGSARIRMKDEASRIGSFWPSEKRPPIWVQIYLSGYSKGHDNAVLHFMMGPSAHGAIGTYFLIKQAGMWRVKWRQFAFYA